MAGRRTRAAIVVRRATLALLVGVPVFFCSYLFFELSGWYAAIVAGILGLVVIYTVVQNDKFSMEARAETAASELKWFQDGWRSRWIRWTYSRRNFQESHGRALETSLDALIFEDLDVVLRALAAAVISIPTDGSVCDSAWVAIRVATGEMAARTWSLGKLFERRKAWPRGTAVPGPAPSSITPEMRLLQPLLALMSTMNGRDAAVFIGRLAGAYIKACPVVRYEQYVFRNPRRSAIDLWPILRTYILENDLLLRINY
jgi:hypothetical protein